MRQRRRGEDVDDEGSAPPPLRQSFRSSNGGGQEDIVADFGPLFHVVQPNGGSGIISLQAGKPAAENATARKAALDDTKISIRTAISQGAPVYNQNNHEGCYEIYLASASRIIQDAAHENGAIHDLLSKAAKEAQQDVSVKKSFTEGAWTLRRAFDEILAMNDQEDEATSSSRINSKTETSLLGGELSLASSSTLSLQAKRKQNTHQLPAAGGTSDQEHQQAPEIFISYSRSDMVFVQELQKKLAKRNFSVWVDTDKIDGGAAWEAAIESSLQASKIVLVVVSNASNESSWVRRETIRAENLGKVRIPLLLDTNSELPLRLLDLQFIDFRGSSSSPAATDSLDGGFCELCQVLEKLLKRNDDRVADARNCDEMDQKIGKAIRLLLLNNSSTEPANRLIQEAICLDNALAASPSDFWNNLTVALSNHSLGSSVSVVRYDTSRIRIRERSQKSNILGGDGDDDTILWSISLMADAGDDNDNTNSSLLLDDVSHVVYKLDSSFQPSQQTVRDRASCFELKCAGWRVATIQILVVFKDGSKTHLQHVLTFQEALGAV